MKPCSQCKVEKEDREFYRDSRHVDGLASECKSCRAVVVKRWRQNNPDKCAEIWKKWRRENSEKVKESNRRCKKAHPEVSLKWRKNNPDKLKSYGLKTHYGMSLETFKNKVLLQDNKCAICKEPMNPPCVDHDHSTGVIRDLLCRGCNIILGAAKESKVILRLATEYLEKFSTQNAQNQQTNKNQTESN